MFLVVKKLEKYPFPNESIYCSFGSIKNFLHSFFLRLHERFRQSITAKRTCCTVIVYFFTAVSAKHKVPPLYQIDLFSLVGLSSAPHFVQNFFPVGNNVPHCGQETTFKSFVRTVRFFTRKMILMIIPAMLISSSAK